MNQHEFDANFYDDAVAKKQIQWWLPYYIHFWEPTLIDVMPILCFRLKLAKIRWRIKYIETRTMSSKSEDLIKVLGNIVAWKS